LSHSALPPGREGAKEHEVLSFGDPKVHIALPVQSLGRTAASESSRLMLCELSVLKLNAPLANR